MNMIRVLSFLGSRFTRNRKRGHGDSFTGLELQVGIAKLLPNLPVREGWWE